MAILTRVGGLVRGVTCNGVFSCGNRAVIRWPFGHRIPISIQSGEDEFELDALELEFEHGEIDLDPKLKLIC